MRSIALKVNDCDTDSVTLIKNKDYKIQFTIVYSFVTVIDCSRPAIGRLFWWTMTSISQNLFNLIPVMLYLCSLSQSFDELALWQTRLSVVSFLHTSWVQKNSVKQHYSFTMQVFSTLEFLQLLFHNYQIYGVSLFCLSSMSLQAKNNVSGE